MADAILNTRHLPERLKRTLAWALEARMTELTAESRTGYSPGAYDPRVDDLVSDTRQAHALGLISYLPKWATWR